MGKASRWFRALLGLKKSDNHRPQPTTTAPPKDKKRWRFVKSYREKDNHTLSHHLSKAVNDHGEDHDPNKHAIAVAAATAAVAEAAAAAAHAAAEVVRLTSSSGRCVANNTPVAYVSEIGNSRHCWREDLAAIKIQSAFRGYLARRALRALKALVRLQALVRGHIQRKRWLQCLQSLAKAQARARAVRKHISDSSQSSSKSSYYHHPGPPTPEKFEHGIRSRSRKFEQSSVLKNLQRIGPRTNAKAVSDEEKAHLHSDWYEHRMDERSWEQKTPVARNGFHDDDKGDKILEVDTGKPHFTTKRRNLFHSLDHYGHSFTNSKDSTNQTIQSLSSSEVQSLTPLKYHRDEEEVFCTAENSPQFYSASSKGGGGRRGPFTPSRSDCSASLLSDYSCYYPNYMSYTESSRAKVRSISAPRQRVQYERSSSTKRYSIHGVGELRSSSSQRASALQASFTSKAYPGSGRLDRLGMPIGQGY